MSDEDGIKLSQITGASIELDLSTGKKYISPLEFRDLGQLESWLEQEPFRKAKNELETYGNVLSPGEREDILTRAREQADKISITDFAKKFSDVSSESAKATGILEALNYILWLCLRHNHHDLRVEDVPGLLKTKDDVFEVIDKIKAFSGLVDLGKEEDQEAEKKEEKLLGPKSLEL